MWMRRALTITSAVRHWVDAEKLAMALIGAILMLAAVDASSRTKAQEPSAGYDLSRHVKSASGSNPVPRRVEDRRRAGSLTASALEMQIVGEARAAGVRDDAEMAVLSGSRMIALLEERGPQDASPRGTRAFHKPAAVILDATGSRAMHPNRAVAQPLEVKVISRVEEGDRAIVAPAASVEEPAGTAAHLKPVVAPTGAAELGGVPPVAAGSVRVAKVSSRSGGRRVASASLARKKSWASPVKNLEARQVAVAQTSVKVVRKVSIAQRTTAHLELTPNDLFLRGLRGPG